jgi:hypothetical protein
MDELTPNEEITTAKEPERHKRRPRDLHRETINRTRPEGCGCGWKVPRRPSLDDLD